MKDTPIHPTKQPVSQIDYEESLAVNAQVQFPSKTQTRRGEEKV